IAADLARGVLILGLLLVRRGDQVWIAYVVMALSMSASAFFEPARTATIPNVTSAAELLPANALSAATWSAMLAIGASVGGLVTAAFGRDVAFVINAASFFCSAICLANTRYDSTPVATPGLAAAAPASNHRPRILHGGGVLHGARRRSDAGTRGDVRAARALRRVHPVGIQHGPAAARSSRSLSRSRIRRGAGTRDAGHFVVEL